MDKTGSSTFKRFRTFLVVGSIAFFLLVIVTQTHQNSIFDLVEEFPKTNLLGGRFQNITTNVLKNAEDVSVTVTPQANGGKGQNVTGSEVGKAIYCNIFLLFTTFLFCAIMYPYSNIQGYYI